MNIALLQQLYIALAGLMAGIYYQHINNCAQINLCVGFVGFILLGLLIKNFYQPLKFKLFILFFCLGSITILTHKKLHALTLDSLKKAKYIVGKVESTQEKQCASKFKYNHVVNLNVYKNHRFKLSLINSSIKLNPGEKILLKPQRLIFFDNNPTNLWSMRERILALALPKKWGLKKIKQRQLSFTQKITAFKEQLLATTLEKMNTSTGKLYGSVFLGKKLIEASDDYRELFCFWGLSHFLARSGLHVSIFAAIIWWLLSFLSFISIFIRSFLALCMLVLYAILSWQSISFYRAFMTLSLILIAKMLKQKSLTVHLICLVAIWILLNNPFELFCADFQLSFSLAFALMISSRYLNKTNYAT